MDVKRTVFCLFILIISASVLAACTDIKTENPEPPKMLIPEVKEYFPMTGSWSYRIEPGSAQPLFYQASDFQILRSPIRLQKRGDGSYLNFKVIYFGETEDGQMALLEVTRDDSNLLRTEYFYWIYSRSDKDVYEMIFYPEGPSGRFMFFLSSYGEKNSRLNLRTGSEDTLVNLGPDTYPPECRSRPCLHFLRTVIKGSGAYNYTDSGFTEDRWFAPGKGMVRLEQRVNGIDSMTWILEQYIPA
jgi:hypothetical protein